MLRDGIGLCLNPYFLGSLSIFDAEPTQETRETSKSLFLNPYFLGSLSINVLASFVDIPLGV